MEYLQGETLAARITRGPIKIDEALKITVEIADAISKAHRAGIVHRDLETCQCDAHEERREAARFWFGQAAWHRDAHFSVRYDTA
jgi:tRNA A-37 threonylcarbamoyl transferase component Bud32